LAAARREFGVEVSDASVLPRPPRRPARTAPGAALA
jgi:hypothetical protein